MLSTLSIRSICIGLALAQRPFVNKQARYSHHRTIDFSSYDADSKTPLSFLIEHGLSLTDQDGSLVEIRDGTLTLYNLYDEAMLQQVEGRVALLEPASDLWVETIVQGALDSCNLHDLDLQQRTPPFGRRSRPSRLPSDSDRGILSYSSQYTYIKTRAASLVYTNEQYAGHTLHPSEGLEWTACKDREVTRIKRIELWWNIKRDGDVQKSQESMKARMGKKEKKVRKEIDLVWQA